MNVAVPETPLLEASQLKRLHILYVITKSNWGGAQRYVYDLAVAGIEKDYEISVACGTEGEMAERLRRANIPVYIVSGLGRDIAPLSDLRAFINVTHLIRTLRPDVVHANSSKAGLIATMAARFAGTPRIIFTAHGWAFNESRPWWQKVIFGVFHLLTVWFSDTIICVSEAVRKDAAWIPFSKRKIVVIHHGIPQGVLLERELARAKLAPHLRSTIWIGTLAELHPTKGLHIAIEAFGRIAAEFPDASLVIIGEGQHRNHLVEFARQYNLKERIHFCGHVQHASTLLSALDVFLFPSRSEALGYAALEAGSASLPVIASRVGGIPEIIEDGISGRLVPVDDIDGFTNALVSLLRNPELRTQYGQALHDRVLTSFSKDRMLAETLALYSNF